MQNELSCVLVETCLSSVPRKLLPSICLDLFHCLHIQDTPFTRLWITNEHGCNWGETACLCKCIWNCRIHPCCLLPVKDCSLYAHHWLDCATIIEADENGCSIQCSKDGEQISWIVSGRINQLKSNQDLKLPSKFCLMSFNPKPYTTSQLPS